MTQLGFYAPHYPTERAADVDYASAGHFVRWLLEWEGAERLVEIFLAEAAGIEQLEDVYQSGYADIEAKFYSESSWSYPRAYRHPAPVLTQVGETQWASELSFDCGQEDIRGTSEGLVALREVTLPAPGFYSLWSSTGGRITATLEIGEIVEAPEQATSSGVQLLGGGISTVPLAAGTYEISVLAPPGIESGVVVVWANQGPVPLPPGGQP
ncbi:MAG: hypothetical protein HC927_00100 [Deltaproteobacteria bacterium]|nr:hypothetical protein [Deltaproteobacteria bacterium]